MLRTASILHSYIDLNVVAFSVCHQCVRWRRKPRWLPVARSKIFRVPEKPQIPDEERVELMRLHNNYRTQVRAIRHYLYTELVKTTSTSQVAQQGAQLEEEEHLQCMAQNELWNKKVADVRAKRLTVAAQVQRETILNRIIAQEQLDEVQLVQIEQIVRDEKLKAPSFITAENIDRAIEEALANTVDPNFSIDLEGNILAGRETKPIAKSTPIEQGEKMKSSNQ